MEQKKADELQAAKEEQQRIDMQNRVSARM
jgi:hypothetical protein